MLVLHHDWGTLHIGHGISEQDIPAWYELESFFHGNFLAFLMFNRGFYPLWDAWIKKYGGDFHSMLTIFDGHAGHAQGEWRMSTSGNLDMPVQEFVDREDGKSGIILLLCCNPENRGRVTSKTSLVIYSRSAMSTLAMQSKRSRQWIHIPGHGDFVGTTDEAKLTVIARKLVCKSPLRQLKPV